MERVYACIDLKSFYASVECCERNLNPLTTNLVVADSERTEKTVCLAVTPSLKQYGLSGRARLYEVVEKIKEVNIQRRKIYGRKLNGKSYDDSKLKRDKSLEVTFIIAKPRMSYYMKYSSSIYNIYLKYISNDDLYVYSIDEVFCDITDYLKLYHLSANELVTKMIKDVYDNTGITATAGIGTNMYLCKIAMDIEAKHQQPNEFGVRIAYLNEKMYREKLWNHEPITDFWRVGKGYANRLLKYNIKTMGDVALCAVQHEDVLYKMFGVNAETLIDHAFGYENVTIQCIKNCKPEGKSLSSGQVLHSPYNYKDARLIVLEMMELLSLELVDKEYVTNALSLNIIYDVSNINNNYYGETEYDHYGRIIPKSSNASITLENYTSSTKILSDKIISLYDKIVKESLLVRKINISVGNLIDENASFNNKVYQQFDLFSDSIKEDSAKKQEKVFLENEKKIQKTILDIKKKYGKNAILKGMNLDPLATTRSRNKEIGGHHE